MNYDHTFSVTCFIRVSILKFLGFVSMNTRMFYLSGGTEEIMCALFSKGDVDKDVW